MRATYSSEPAGVGARLISPLRHHRMPPQAGQFVSCPPLIMGLVCREFDNGICIKLRGQRANYIVKLVIANLLAHNKFCYIFTQVAAM